MKKMKNVIPCCEQCKMQTVYVAHDTLLLSYRWSIATDMRRSMNCCGTRSAMYGKVYCDYAPSRLRAVALWFRFAHKPS